MPSSIVVTIPENKKPSIASALLMVAAEEEAKERQKDKSFPSKNKSVSPTTAAAADVGVAASAVSASSSTKRKFADTGDNFSDSIEPLPKKAIYKSDVSMIEGGEKDNNNKTQGEQKPNIQLCSAEGCKNKPTVGRFCLVHGAKMSLLTSNGTIVDREIMSKPKEDYTPAPPFQNDDDDSYHEGVTEWPLTNIAKPGKNDCLLGRGGGTNHNPGNKAFRKLVHLNKAEYISKKRHEKPIFSMSIVRSWRERKPPGRFLVYDKSTKLWNDVGDDKAREKTSQALREKIYEPKNMYHKANYDVEA